jgi:peptidoglycan-associated lipoprotein
MASENKFRLMAILLMTGLLAGCPQPLVEESDAADQEVSESEARAAAEADAAARAAEEARREAEAVALAAREAAAADPLNDPESPLADRVIYFDYDRSDIRSEFLQVITAHARYLVANPDRMVRLEGHADERGSREYNIALGDRRAQAVRRVFLFQGVRAQQIEVVSYGEERPAVEGHDDESWALNRRVEIAY